ncbi:MAG: DNA-directed RNA polymerase subunit B [Candidatus Heimdallarchaeota archaeon]|nr:DNA-directed RNA polymerase subunit B [Candidatus Heimdallarchaeota archaeon]
MYNEFGLVRQHLHSFNEFVEKKLNEIVQERPKIEPDIEGFYVKLAGIEVGEPSVREADGSERAIHPMEARIRNLIYSAPLNLKMRPVYVTAGVEEEREEVIAYIGRLPIMLKSKSCLLYNLNREELIRLGEDPEDPGGYFIVNGSERVIVTQEYLVSNRVLVDEGRKGSSTTAVAKVFSTVAGFRSLVSVQRRKDGRLLVNFFSVPRPLPLAVLIKALGVTIDRDIANLVSNDPEIIQELLPTLREAAEIVDQEEALDFIGKRVAVGQTRQYRILRAKQVLDNYLLPHVGKDESYRSQKALYLAQMSLKVIELNLGRIEADDKDHYANKRLKLAGEMLTSLFRVAFHSLYRDIKYQLEKGARRGKIPNLRVAMRADVITERIRHALATGNWVGGKAGVSQLLDRTNYMSTYSHLRRVISPLIRSQAHFEARDLHATHWGKICPNETPEGPNCGLVKNLAMQAYISIGSPEKPVKDFIFNNCDITPVEESIDHAGIHILLNGNLICTTRKPDETFHLIREARRTSKLHPEINLAYFPENRVISINTDEGRVRRPLIILDKAKEGSKLASVPRLKVHHIEKLRKKDLTFSDLVNDGIIEFLDAEEEENAYIAMTFEEIEAGHTHVEISPSAILGICASIIPYAEHNQSPRNTYEAGMTKQALGLYASNFYFRTDRRAHILQAPQIPLVGSKAMDVIGFNDRPAGQNFIVAILSFQGYNIEDAIILNRASVERGLARSHFFRSYVAEEKKYLGGQEDRFEIPQKGVRGYRAKEVYRHLSEVDGIIDPEIEVGGGDILVGRTSRPRFLEEYIELESLESSTPQRRETSIAIRHGEKGIVDGVILTETSEGSTLVKIKVRDQRIPELGDKFASRHGQKGIIGHIVPQTDMPFTEEGIVPDLIINPHAIPSRMTVGQIIECMSAIVACYDGKQIDATLFESPDPEDIASSLRKLGFHPYAESVMYDGINGQMLPARIFIGPTYYQKLHHLVADKIHARARGPIQILTRQPTEGRAREGGLRFGEMERDCLIGHGAALLLKERLLEESDKTEIFICEKCGLIATWDRKKDQTYCSVCGNVDTGIYKIAISYAFKLLLQELMSLTIKPQLILTDSTH